MDTERIAAEASKLRRNVIEMLHNAGSGHPGGSLSLAEILATLYFDELKNLDPNDPLKENRDRLILSKGHAAPALYSILAQRGFIDEKVLGSFRQFKSILQGHPDMRKVPGIEISSGSLGMGISFGIGTALATRMNNLDYRTYVITGDGELNEGQIWEAFMCAAKYALDSLTVIVDYNKIQLDGTIDEIMPLGDLRSKIESFGWNVVECDGHDIESLKAAFSAARARKGMPTAILAHTVKGKGVSFMENKNTWHGARVDDHAYQQAVLELEAAKIE